MLQRVTFQSLTKIGKYLIKDLKRMRFRLPHTSLNRIRNIMNATSVWPKIESIGPFVVIIAASGLKWTHICKTENVKLARIHASAIWPNKIRYLWIYSSFLDSLDYIKEENLNCLSNCSYKERSTFFLSSAARWSGEGGRKKRKLILPS